MTFSPSTPLPSEAVSHLHAGRIIDAIKVVRETEGLQLKDAKDRVDAYVRTQPALRQVLAEKRAQAKGTLVRWLLVAGCLGAVGYVASRML